MNSRNNVLSKYFGAKQNRRRKAKQRQKRLNMGLPAAVPLKHVSLNQGEKEAIASTEVIGTARRKKLFVTRYFAWPVSLGIHLFVAFLVTIYAIREYIPEPEPVSLAFMEPTREPRKPPIRIIKPAAPPDSLVIQVPDTPPSTPPVVEFPTEQTQFPPTEDLIDTEDAPVASDVSIPKGFGNIQVEQKRPEIPTEAPGVKIERDPSIAPDDPEIGDIPDPGGRTIDAEVSVEVDQDARVLRKVDPKYPEAARRAQREGVVELECTVGVDGRAADIKVIKEEPKGFSFGEAAIEALKKWRFTPANKGGESVPQRVKIPIRFTLDDD
jgi:protein TonB